MTECKSKKGNWNCLSFAWFFKEVYRLKQNAALRDERFDDRKNKSVLAL